MLLKSRFRELSTKVEMEDIALTTIIFKGYEGENKTRYSAWEQQNMTWTSTWEECAWWIQQWASCRCDVKKQTLRQIFQSCANLEYLWQKAWRTSDKYKIFMKMERWRRSLLLNSMTPYNLSHIV